jgi:hypothetical protein
MNREQRRALERATNATRAAGTPAAAAEIEALRQVRTGSYALMHVLVSRLGGGPIDIPRAEWKALPPRERLRLQVDPDTNDARLWIETGQAEPVLENVNPGGTPIFAEADGAVEVDT